MLNALLALQLFHVVFLALHDWVPLGGFNDLRAVRTADPIGKLVAVTAVSTTPFALGLAVSVLHFGRSYPTWLLVWLAIMYAALFVGELRAWWIPYFLRPDPDRAARYRLMFGRTHALLPARKGIRPNTLHVILHAATLATLVLLAIVILRRL